MASAGENSQLISDCECPDVPNCEVTLVLDDKARLTVCKRILINKCEFFKGLFSFDFREKNSNEVKIQQVSCADMLLFLACEFGSKALPLDSESLCTLISLADQFICPSLQERLNNHLGTEFMFLNLSPASKMDLLFIADKYKVNGLYLLETCIRLCANIDFEHVTMLENISCGAVYGVYQIKFKARDLNLRISEQTTTHYCFGRKAEGQSWENIPYNRSSMKVVDSKRVQVMECSDCKSTKIKETFNYETVKEFEIDPNLLKG